MFNHEQSLVQLFSSLTLDDDSLVSCEELILEFKDGSSKSSK